MSTRLRALGAVAAIVLLTGGCAAGTHPGAAAVVGTTEISIGDVDKTSQAVSTALGQNYNTAAALSDLVNNAILGQVKQDKSISVTPAETATAAKSAVGDDEATFQKFQSDTVTRDFLNEVATAAVVTVKLGGGTIKDLQDQAKLQQGLLAVKDASKDIKVSVAPRFGQWTDGKLDTSVSGSLSVESDQTAAKRKAAADAAQQAQPQG
ncbi:hypothetical protein ACFWUU_22800 [Kribbella sp. NPDC058693]|uniref:SurA-like protein n=1 Tax=Kribbella jiaozuonensis TaxID=2575441 RepID=A0A4U3LGE2_9ACTN|nr:hypothetical protein [Kribbella jiaozuonensis]TKK74628.1 hypothetical protein FDA38_38395 [Kribbella jiaozuonensis]